MNPKDQSLHDVQALAARRIALIAWAGVPLSVLAAVLFTGANPVIPGVISALFALVGQVGTRLPDARTGRILAGQALVGQAIALTAAFAGHDWQVDTHMAFFAVLAVLVALVDIRAILFGAATIVVHHLSLSLFMPSLLYPSTDLLINVERTLLHGAIVAGETFALVQAVRVRLQMDALAATRATELQAAMTAAEAAQATAEAAQQAAEDDKAAAESARAEAERAHQDIIRQQAEAEAARRSAAEAESREAESRARAAAQQAGVVERLGAALGDLAQGRLDARIDAAFPEDYEALRRDFNAAAETLAEAIALVVESADSIRNEANEIASASNDLNRRTEQQAATLEETAAALDQLTASVKSAAEVAGNASTMVKGMQERAQRSGSVMRDTIAAMEEIADGSGKISKITGVIDEIAFQTNLLALNAGVEAARAGEAGRGFAVVASEVRALAQRSSDAAREIADLIDLSSSQVSRGVSLVGEAGEAIGSIEDSVGDIRERVGEIATSAAEQATGIQEINVAVNQLDQATQQNAALSEQTNAATQSLLSMSSTLIDATARFDLGAGGGRAALRSSTAPAPAPAAEPAASLEPAAKLVAAGGGGAATAAATDWEEF